MRGFVVAVVLALGACGPMPSVPADPVCMDRDAICEEPADGGPSVFAGCWDESGSLVALGTCDLGELAPCPDGTLPVCE